MKPFLAALATIPLLLSGCSSEPAKEKVTITDGAAADPAWDKFQNDFLEKLFKVDPYFAVYQGRHEYDGQLPDWSEAGLKAQADFLKGAIKDAQAFDDAGLSPQQRFERQYLVAVAKGRLFWLTEADQPHRNPAYYVGGGLDPNVYIARP